LLVVEIEHLEREDLVAQNARIHSSFASNSGSVEKVPRHGVASLSLDSGFPHGTGAHYRVRRARTTNFPLFA